MSAGLEAVSFLRLSLLPQRVPFLPRTTSMASIDILLAVMAALVAACFAGYSLTDNVSPTSVDQN